MHVPAHGLSSVGLNGGRVAQSGTETSPESQPYRDSTFDLMSAFDGNSAVRSWN
jgi:hypothetical protein